MLASEQTLQLFETLKALLSNKGLTYKDVAERLAISESSVKRIFSLRDCDISRVAKICEIAGTTITEVATAAGQLRVPYFEMPAETEQFFEENLDYFVFYRQLSIAKSVDSVTKASDLDQRSVSRYLKKLEELNLIDRLPGGEVRLKHEGYFRFREGSRLKTKFIHHWLPSFTEHVRQRDGDSNHSIQCFSTGLKPEQLAKLKDDIQQMIRHYHDQGFLDQTLSPSEVGSVGVAFIIGPQRVGEGLKVSRL